jgi:hypothetical protein
LGKVKARKARVSLLKQCHDSKSLAIVVESTGVSKQFIKRVFPGMAKWWMPDVVAKSEGFREIFI